MKLRSLVLGLVVLGVWVSPAAADTVKLTVNVDGNGTVTASGQTADCTDSCTYDVVKGQRLTLTATGGASSLFGSWTGCTPTTGQGDRCTITPTDAATVSAGFIPAVKLTVNVAGNGTVRSHRTAGGTPLIDCPGRCSALFPAGAITLVSTGDHDWNLDGWSDQCPPNEARANWCNAQVGADDTITATFAPAGNYSWFAAKWGAIIVLLIGTVFLLWVRSYKKPETTAPQQGGAVNGIDNRWSTSRLAMVIWTYAVLFAFVVLLIRYGTRVFPGTLQDEYLVLLGIPGASAVAASAITSAQVEKGSAKTSLPTPTKNWLQGLGQIFSDDTGQLDLLDTQYFAFNVVLLIFFLSAFFGMHVTTTDTLLPDLPDSLLAVSGVAAATYVGKKALKDNAPGEATVPPGTQLLLPRASSVTVPTGATLKLTAPGKIKAAADAVVEVDAKTTHNREGQDAVDSDPDVSIGLAPRDTLDLLQAGTVTFTRGGTVIAPKGALVEVPAETSEPQPQPNREPATVTPLAKTP